MGGGVRFESSYDRHSKLTAYGINFAVHLISSDEVLTPAGIDRVARMGT